MHHLYHLSLSWVKRQVGSGSSKNPVNCLLLAEVLGLKKTTELFGCAVLKVTACDDGCQLMLCT